MKWPITGTKIYAEIYQLEIRDSSKILIDQGDVFSLLSPHDSSLIGRFEIKYSEISSDAEEYFKTNANQQVINTSNPNVIEYYSFVNSNVLFIGYSSADTLKPFTIFDLPLIISPIELRMKMKSSGKMKTFIAANNSLDEGFNTHLKVKEIKQITLEESNNNSKVCSLREMVFTKDATVGFGQNNLIVPEAIMSKTKFLVDLNGYPIAEWSIKIGQKPEKLAKYKLEKYKKPKIKYTKYRVKIY
ncbi:MAG: hypothetical protein GY936_10505 [Ignavibacteriae bacterium]|nr:hypothetical protein [Ignavibacteriota bacterium]